MVAPRYFSNGEDCVLRSSPPPSSRVDSLDSQEEETTCKERNQRLDVSDDSTHSSSMNSSSNSNSPVVDIAMLERSSAEVERLRRFQALQRQHDDDPTNKSRKRNPCRKFPAACMTVLQHMPGNDRCVDCGAHDPTWAALSYGALLCLQCSGYHRSLGVQVSCVRSITMDDWSSMENLLSMMEGGNAQLASFFARHKLCRESTTATAADVSSARSSKIHKDNVTQLRYRTKAALFYRQQLKLHVQQLLLQNRPYQGRVLRSPTKRKPELQHRNSCLE